MYQELLLYAMRGHDNLSVFFLSLPTSLQIKILMYYLSYGTVASRAVRDGNGNSKCMDCELTIWNPQVEWCPYNKNKDKCVLRQSIGFTNSMSVLYDMRLAITKDDPVARTYVDYIEKTFQKITKTRLLQLMQEESRIKYFFI